jgi:putative tricarboxylic transport membrane protein
MFGDLLGGIAQALSPPTVGWLLFGAAIGLMIGVLPAVGATVGVVLFLPFTYSLDLPTAIVFLLAIYTTGQYGDSVSSILLRTPGGPGTIASCWDGYPMTQRGEGARALGIATFASMTGGLIGAIILVGLAYPLTQGAMELQPPEYLVLGIAALGLVSVASNGQTGRGVVMAAAGLLVSFVGQDPVGGFIDRFSFGIDYLSSGVPELTVFVGLFAITQILVMLRGRGTDTTAPNEHLSYRQAWRGFGDVASRPGTVLRSSLSGTAIGILPGLGVTTATITAYLLEKRRSPERERFGKGAPAGLVSAEVAKGTCAVGDMIPTLTLGIPGSLTGAIILSAFILQGVQPGPMFLSSGSEPFIMFAGITLTQLLIVVAGFPLIKAFTQITRVPNRILAPVLVVLCFLGSFVERNQIGDMLFLIVAGLFGYALVRSGYPAITFVLGIILGPEIERNFHRTMQMGGGSPELLWQRPLAVTLLVITAAFFCWPLVRRGLRRRRGADIEEEPTAADAPDEEPPGAERPSARHALVLEVALTAAAAVFLVVSLGYPRATAAFPLIVSVALLVLASWRTVHSIRSRAWRREEPSAPQPPLIERITGGWPLAAGSLVAYFLAIQLVGFVAASVLYLAVVPLLYRYRSIWPVVGTALGCGVLLVLAANNLGIILPDGSWS